MHQSSHIAFSIHGISLEKKIVELTIVTFTGKSVAEETGIFVSCEAAVLKDN